MAQGMESNLLAKEPAYLAKPWRAENLRWEKVENKASEETDYQVSFEDTCDIGFTTVTTARAVKAPSRMSEIRATLQQKFVQILEQTYANCFHHNRLVAKVAEWMVGNVLSRLALLGMSLQELEKIKRRIRKQLTEENYNALCQVIYDETVLEIVG